MMATAWSLAMRQLRRDIRLSEYVVVFCALVLAVAALTSVGFFANRVERAMVSQASTLLAADLVARSNNPVPDAVAAQAAQRGIRSARLTEFPSVVLNESGDTALVSVKAVDGDYPLRGELLLSDELYGASRQIAGPPQPGEVWVDSRLPGTLPVEPGQQLSLGDISVAASAFIAYEPDRAGDVFQMAPRVIMAAEDLPRAGLLGEGSRARYRMLFAGDEAAINDFADWLNDQTELNLRVVTPEEGRPAVRSALVNARRFLGLAAALAVLLSGAAVALSARQIAERDMDTSSLLRTFGASRALVLRLVAIRLLVLALVAGLVGSLLGYIAQFGLSAMLARWFATDLPQPSLLPLIGGFACSIIAMAGFCLPSVVRAADAPVVRVLRRDLPASQASLKLLLACGLLALTALLVWLTRDLLVAVLLVVAVVAVFGLLSAVSRGLVALASRPSGERWRRLLSGIKRRPGSVTLQIAAFGVGLLALLLLAIVRADVLNTWQRQIPPDAPNFFLVNIQPDEVPSVRDFFIDREIGFRSLFPMVRGRLERINDTPVADMDFAGKRNEWTIRRDFNLSFADEARDDNPIVDGQWWQPETTEQLLSLELDFADELGVEIGDVLHFRVAEALVSGRISNLREVEWESFSPNFFVVGSPATFRDSPASYITSVQVRDDHGGFVRELVSRFPSVTVLEVGSILERVSGIMNRAAAAVQYVFLFTVFAGILVLIAAVLASRRERFREAAILRTLGASRQYLRGTLGREFAVIGLLSGVLAATVAAVIGWIIVEQVMDLSYHFNPWLWLTGVAAGLIGIWTAGMLVTRPVLDQSPVDVLRNQV